MSLKQLTKSQLVEMCRDLNIGEEGTKPIIEEKLAQHFDNHPELGEHNYYKKFYIFRQKNSPVKKAAVVLNDFASSPSYKVLKPLTDKLKSSPSKILSMDQGFKNKSSPYKSAQEGDEEEDDEDEEEEEDEDSDEIEQIDQEEYEQDDVASKTSGKDSEIVEDDEDFEDSDYKQRFELVTKFRDWFIGKYEEFHEYAEDQKEEFIYSTKKLNSDARKKLSTTDSINGLSTMLELGLLIYQQVPLVPIKDATFLSQEIISKYKFINPDFNVWDIASLIQFKFLLVLLTWSGLSIFIPLLFSYYFNFIGIKKSKKTKFDPLVFSIAKLMLNYFFLSSSNVSFQDIKDDAAVWANAHGLIESATYLQKINAHLFHNSITLRLILGDIPLISSSVGILVALYVASL